MRRWKDITFYLCTRFASIISANCHAQQIKSIAKFKFSLLVQRWPNIGRFGRTERLQIIHFRFIRIRCGLFKLDYMRHFAVDSIVFCSSATCILNKLEYMSRVRETFLNALANALQGMCFNFLLSKRKCKRVGIILCCIWHENLWSCGWVPGFAQRTGKEIQSTQIW